MTDSPQIHFADMINFFTKIRSDLSGQKPAGGAVTWEISVSSSILSP
jgi:hypothetical protein